MLIDITLVIISENATLSTNICLPTTSMQTIVTVNKHSSVSELNSYNIV